MRLAMKPDEQGLLESVLRCASKYVEFGSGGSTVFAAGIVKDWIITVDSAVEWLERVRLQAEESKSSIKLTLVHADIGPTKDWVYPVDQNSKPKWDDYHTKVWEYKESAEADFYLVDGRFRVACFMQTLLRGNPYALIGIHDFTKRPHYAVVHEVAREIARASDLSIFIRRPDIDMRRVRDLLQEHRLLPD